MRTVRIRAAVALVSAVLAGWAVLFGAAGATGAPARHLDPAAITARPAYARGDYLYARYDAGRRHAPWILFVHGGYWRAGSADTPWERSWAEHERARGFQAFSAAYRLSTVAPWPAQLDDVLGAVAWIRSHATRYGIDPDRGVIVGHSAGGQLAAISGLEAHVRGIVEIDGALDPLAALHAANRRLRTAARSLLGCAPAACPADWASARAETHVGGRMPPVLLVHSRGDRTVPATMSEAFYRALRAAGDDATLVLLPGRSHTPQASPPVVAMIDSFADRVTASAN